MLLQSTELSIIVAKNHGFTQIPIIIADGELGEEYELVEINEPKVKHFKKFKIGKELPIIAKDIGVLASTDPIALDLACLELLKENEHKKVFSGEKIFKHAEEIGLGRAKYDLVKL